MMKLFVLLLGLVVANQAFQSPYCYGLASYHARRIVVRSRRPPVGHDVRHVTSTTRRYVTPTPNDPPKLPPKEQKVSFLHGAIIAIPLLFKLAVVLSIKFLMDLIVFPLLFLYRFLMLVKRRIAKLFNPSDDLVNKSNATPADEAP